MLAKTWKKIGLIVLIVACLWNIISKLTNIISFDVTLDSIKSYIQTFQEEDNKDKKQNN